MSKQDLRGRPLASTLTEAESICQEYFVQGCRQPLSIFEVVDTVQYHPVFNIVRGDETNSGRSLCGQCKVRFVKVIYPL